jgi:hypothetical protein
VQILSTAAIDHLSRSRSAVQREGHIFCKMEMQELEREREKERKRERESERKKTIIHGQRDHKGMMTVAPPEILPLS